VLCDLSRARGVDIHIDDPWAYNPIALGAADVGDSLPVDNADARYERAIERGIGEITIIPENCHQEIREPARAISEIRKLVTAEDRLSTLTYVEEVGGFVDPTTNQPYISDYPDVDVDILHDRGDLSAAPIVGDDDVYTAHKTPFVIRPDNFTRNADGHGTGKGHRQRCPVARGRPLPVEADREGLRVRTVQRRDGTTVRDDTGKRRNPDSAA